MKNITLPDGTVTLEGDIKGKFYSITITDSGVSKSVYADSSKTQFIAKNWTDDNNFYQRESYSTDAAGNKTTPYTDFADVFNSTVVVAQHSTLGRNALMEMRRQK